MSLDIWKILVIAAAVLGGAATFTALEVLSDGDQLSVFEWILDTVETALILTGAGGVVLLVQRMHADHREKLELRTELEIARAEGRGWRNRVQSHVAGIGAEIERQFEAWGLSDAESEVGLLVLKGLTHKDIASLRGTAEATVRQQARAIYQKSGLPGKTAFTAYFLEDLLPPSAMRSADFASPYDANAAPRALSTDRSQAT